MNGLDRQADQLARLPASAAAEAARQLLRHAKEQGVWPAPISPVHLALAAGRTEPLTVPAFNLRGLTYDTARAIYRRMLDREALAVMFELAPSESATGDQSFVQYAALIAAAALREGWRGPVFLQGDHFSLEQDTPTARQQLTASILELLECGYGQVDLDTAALAIAGESAVTRQLPNAKATVALLQSLAADTPAGTMFGGEVGEIGGSNTTPEDLQVFIDLVRWHAGPAAAAFGKVSVQTGTRHGGMTDSDGKVTRMPLDLELARQLADVAHENGFAGIVQHGASTLQPDQFAALPDAGVVEVHLATNIQNLVFDSPAFPTELRAQMKEVALASSAGSAERGGETGATDAELAFSQKRWSMWGPFKKQLLDLPAVTRHALAETVADWADSLLTAFRQTGRAAELRKMFPGP